LEEEGYQHQHQQGRPSQQRHAEVSDRLLDESLFKN
jgi:hypothetical protein